VAPRIVSGRGADALAADPRGVLVATEIATGFGLKPGDTLGLTIFPDDFENATNLSLRVAGVYRSFPPTNAPAQPPELVMTTAAIPRVATVPPDFYLARVAPGHWPRAVAAELRSGPLAGQFSVATVGTTTERGLTALDLGGLGRISSVGGALIAAVGIAVLGAFLVLERGREFAILRTVGASTREVLTGPVLEGAIAAVGSVAIGIPVGLGLSAIAVRILALFFQLPPPLLSVPGLPTAAMVLFTLGASAVALGAAFVRVTRASTAAVLRGP
jgi:putative ABC transport system permease protein